MSEVKTRKVHTPEFKAKVGLEALRGVKTINEISQEHGVHPAPGNARMAPKGSGDPGPARRGPARDPASAPTTRLRRPPGGS
jgi:transposase-like protein